MPERANQPDESHERQKEASASRRPALQSRSGIPRSMKHIFERFPLILYPANNLPLRAPHYRSQNTLHIFTDAKSAARGSPSFNPSCLKWQTYFHMKEISFSTKPSTNHASPSGALPFMIPGNKSASAAPISVSSFPKWAAKMSKTIPSTLTPIELVYNTLLTTSIRLAYLYTLYVDMETFDNVAGPLYVHTASSSPIVQRSLAHPLRMAALDEIMTARVQGPGKIDVERLFIDSYEAWDALSALLDAHDWFTQAANTLEDGNGKMAQPTRNAAPEKELTTAENDEFEAQRSHQGDSERCLFEDAAEENDSSSLIERISSTSGSNGPGLLDAAVFAYTQVILNLFADSEAAKGEPTSPQIRLVKGIKDHPNLLKHRKRILSRYYSSAAKFKDSE